jgi:hypothetical protein
MTDRTTIAAWIKEAPKGTTHVVIATDTFDWQDYPVYVAKGDDVKAEVARLSDPNKMSKVMEVYDLSKPVGAQLRELRAWHL